MTIRPVSRWTRLGLTAVTTLAALLAAWFMGEVTRESPFVPFLAAVMVSAWYGGLWPGVLSGLFGALAINFFFISPQHSLRVFYVYDILRLALFLWTAVLISHLNQQRKKSEDNFQLLEAAMRQTREAVIIALAKPPTPPHVVYVNSAFTEMTGYSLEEVRGKSPLLLHEEAVPPAGLDAMRMTLAAGHSFSGETAGRRKDGERLLLQTEIQPISGKHGQVGHYVFVHRNISEQKKTGDQLREAAEEIHDLYNQAPCGYHTLDADGVFLRINDTELNWLGYRREDLLGVKKITSVLSEASRKRFKESLPRLQEQGWLRDVELEMVRRDGSVLPVLISAVAVRTPDGLNSLSNSTVYDMTELKRVREALQQAHDEQETRVHERTAELASAYLRLEASLAERKRAEESLLQAKEAAETARYELEVANRQLETLSHTDGLTRLNNRRYFMELLQQEFSRAQRYGRLFCLLMLDIDHFKEINDRHGHWTGDEALAAVAREISGMVRQSDIAARYGGEEFVVLLTEVSLAGGRAFAERLRRQIAAISLRDGAGIPFNFTCSIGVVQMQNSMDSPAALLKAADAAMYQAKSSGRNNVVLFDSGAVRKRKVLIIDDDEALLRTMVRGLETLKIPLEVDSTTSSYQGCIRFGEFSPDLVILDFQMEGINGTELLQSMKKMNHGNRTKFLAVSGFPDRLAEMMESGCNDCLGKPFTLDELTLKVGSLLNS